MKVLSEILVPTKKPIPVRVLEEPKTQAKPPRPMLNKSLVLNPTGASVAYALPPGCRRVSVFSTKTAWLELGTGGAVATAADSHYINTDERRDFDLSLEMTHIAIIDTGGVAYVSCYE